MKIIKSFFSYTESSALFMLVVMMIAFSFASPYFFTYDNFLVVLQPFPELALIAVGVTVLMLSGEFDLSVGSVFILAPMTMIILINREVGLFLAMFAGLAVATLVGWINAAITLKLGLPSFITTLGTLFMARSLAIVFTGKFIPKYPNDLDVPWLVGRIDLLRVSVFWLLGIALLVVYILKRTDFGSWIYATGGNMVAARDMGVNVKRVKTVCFMLCSLLSGFAGMILVFRIQSIVPTIGSGFELTAIAAAVIGGVALTGGIGSVWGGIIGALLIALIENIIVLSRIDASWFKFALGSMIVISVLVNRITRSMGERKIKKKN